MAKTKSGRGRGNRWAAKMTRFICLAKATSVALMLAACASSSVNYRTPSTYNITTEKVLNFSFSKAWDSYVAKLSESFFVINNISKESRIINVSFGTNQPGEFVDCGHTTRTSNHPATGKQTFSYEVADDSVYNAGVQGTNVVWRVRRDTSLEGRANIYMAPNGNQTNLKVNARYVWSSNVSASSNVGGTGLDHKTVSFSTKEIATQSDESFGTLVTWSCRSNGTLEKRLLNLI